MKILRIEEFEDMGAKDFGPDCDRSSYEGYKIVTDEKTFKIGVSNSASCCESWGHISSEDNFEDFIGAEIVNYKCKEAAEYTDIDLTKKNVGEYVDVYDCAFIDFNTSKGTLQFAVYNHHNGYYGHDIRIIEDDVR